jgi:hypothetical protein
MRKKFLLLALIIAASPTLATESPGSPTMSPEEKEVRAVYTMCQHYRDLASGKWKAGYENCDKIEKALMSMQAGNDQNQIDSVAAKH